MDLGERLTAQRDAIHAVAAQVAQDAAAEVAATTAQQVVVDAVSNSSDQIATVIGEAVKTYVDDRISQLASDNNLVSTDPAPEINIATPVVANDTIAQ